MEYFAKQRLKDKVAYLGVHPDTSIGTWDAQRNSFWYVSLDYRFPTPVELKHPTDGGTFKPIGELFGYGDTETMMKGMG